MPKSVPVHEYCSPSISPETQNKLSNAIHRWEYLRVPFAYQSRGSDIGASLSRYTGTYLAFHAQSRKAQFGNDEQMPPGMSMYLVGSVVGAHQRQHCAEHTQEKCRMQRKNRPP
ncbi:hypothetical protein HGRIS_008167 [Hohenbuehelia grisea]|uniref:Uncharacterized protein n=1 Tax=Hohenbuehelia grisea TaxID=104357 RepID=A0ABR3J7K8_9AGAR